MLNTVRSACEFIEKKKTYRTETRGRIYVYAFSIIIVGARVLGGGRR